jgi:proteasome activator subunit 4
MSILAHYFDGARSLLFDRLFDALKPGAGAHHDVMKGSLFVLGSKMFGNLAILDWRHSTRYLLALLACSHQERPSVQNLVKTITHDFVIRLAEPSTLKASVNSEGLNRAADHLDGVISALPDAVLVERVAQKARDRVDQKNGAYAALLPKLLEIAKSPETHWRYALTATRFLRALIRRDQVSMTTISIL